MDDSPSSLSQSLSPVTEMAPASRQVPSSPVSGPSSPIGYGIDNPPPEAAINRRQEGKPFAFALAHGIDGASIWHGCLLSSITLIRVYREDGKNYILSQDPIPKLVYKEASNLTTSNTNKLLQTHLGWYGNVYAYWEADENGNVTLFDIRGEDGEPEGQDISTLEEDLSRVHPDGKYFVLIGTVNQNAPVVQKISSDITWAVTILVGAEGSSSGSSDGSDDSSGDSSPSDGSDGPPGSSGTSEGEKSSNAIVAGPWTAGGFVALATMESNQVLFEFVLRDIALKGPVTKVKIDPRFLFVCEPDSLCVAAAPCGDAPYAVGASVRKGTLTLTGQARSDRRPKSVNVRLTGIRKGFKEWDMPSRTAKQKAQSEEARKREYDR